MMLLDYRYHERYFPENFYTDDRQDYEEEHRERAQAPVRHQVSSYT